jgi:biuret amidohydrolase
MSSPSVRFSPPHLGRQLDPKKTALLVIDMQYFDAHPKFGICAGMEKISPGSMSYFNQRLEQLTVPAIESILDIFRSNNLKVIYVVLSSDYADYRDCNKQLREWNIGFEKKSGIQGFMWKDSPLSKIRDELSPMENEPIVRKKTFGAFASSDLEEVLKRMDIESLVFSGVTTSCCVETTAREAYDRGFNCLVVDDGTCDMDDELQRNSLKTFKFLVGDVLKNVIELRTALKVS